MMPAADSWRQPDRRFVVTGAARPRDIRDLMGRPFFALGKTPRLTPIDYQARHIAVMVRAESAGGMATVWDVDVLIWLTGQIVDALTFVPAENNGAEHTPDYRIHLGDGDSGPEIGAGWTRTGERAGEYISIVLDDPSFIQPVRATLFQAGRGGREWQLVWNRPAKRPGGRE